MHAIVGLVGPDTPAKKISKSVSRSLAVTVESVPTKSMDTLVTVRLVSLGVIAIMKSTSVLRHHASTEHAQMGQHPSYVTVPPAGAATLARKTLTTVLVLLASTVVCVWTISVDTPVVAPLDFAVTTARYMSMNAPQILVQTADSA
jgi:hypothetical protein